jgi:hypothetical protein
MFKIEKRSLTIATEILTEKKIIYIEKKKTLEDMDGSVGVVCK